MSMKRLLLLVVVVSFLTGGAAGALVTTVRQNVAAIRTPGTSGGLLFGTREVVQEESAVIAAVERVSPAVVSIVIYKKLGSLFNRTGPFAFDPFFFGFDTAALRDDGALRPVGGGSGFIITSDGLIVTNRHVVDDGNASYRVALADGREFDAEVKAKDEVLDFALLKINATDLPVVALGDSDAIRIGQSVVAIGNALSEFANTVTSGVVSGINRRVVAGDGAGSEVIEEAIQTDAAINPGNSGGPLITVRGEVIGINTAVSQQGQLVGFATPINAVKPLIASFEQQGRFVRPWLGVRYTMLTPALAEQAKLPVKDGAYIVPRDADDREPGVVPDGPAAKAGLKEGDVIIEVGGRPVNTKRSLSRVIAEFQPNTDVNVKVIRDGAELTLTVRLGEFGK